MDLHLLGERFIDRLFDPFTIAAIGGAVATVIISVRNKAAISKKLDENTELTKKTGKEVEETLVANASKFDSAAKVAKEEARQEAVQVATKVLVAAEKANQETKQAVIDVNRSINGRMDEMIRAAKDAAYAEGLLTGKKSSEKVEADIKAIQTAIAKLLKEKEKP